MRTIERDFSVILSFTISLSTLTITLGAARYIFPESTVGKIITCCTLA